MAVRPKVFPRSMEPLRLMSFAVTFSGRSTKSSALVLWWSIIRILFAFSAIFSSTGRL